MADRAGQRLGNYRLIRLLGQGSFAEVYLAEHIYLKTQVAVKVLYTHLAQDELPGFLQEAQTIARLKHPHIIHVSDFGIDGTPYLVMDYLPNGSLRQRHPKGSKLSFDTIVTYVNQIASALQYAHDNKVIHRDIKPENILISSTGEIILSDFGIATTAHQTTSLKTVNASGTPAYMAPEHIAGKPRPASDQYALGMMVYEWLLGRPAFYGEPLAVMYQQTYAPIPSLHEQDPKEISEDIEKIVLQAIAKDPQERFVNIQTFATTLELHEFIELVEAQLMNRIILTMQKRGMSLEEGHFLARDFLALMPFKDIYNVLEGLKILSKVYIVAEQVYFDASKGREELISRIAEADAEVEVKSEEFKAQQETTQIREPLA